VRHRLEATTATGRRVLLGSAVTAALTLAVVMLGVPVAGADSGWSRVPSSGLGGGTVDLASSSTTLCQWTQPAAAAVPAPGDPTPAATDASPTSPAADPATGDVVYDGTEVQVRLSHAGGDVPVGTLPVMHGGAWSGTVTVPGTDVLTPGDYDLFVKCVIDRPELDGVRTYDFDPLPFTVTESPPPTTVDAPPELIPPVTVTNPIEVQGEQITRPAATPAATAATPTAATATLPNTGDGTLETALAGIAALLVGAGALWLGARHGRRHPSADLAD
jgi:LPXTG-motif cell wall-anchored protein